MSLEGVADLKTLKDYVLIAGDVYRRLPGGVLARCVSLQEAAKKLTEVHKKSYEFRDGVSLYCRLPGGVLARCVSLREAAKKLTEVHKKSCEFRDGVSFYRDRKSVV